VVSATFSQAAADPGGDSPAFTVARALSDGFQNLYEQQFPEARREKNLFWRKSSRTN
jgi:hypothetical protein